MTDLPPIVRNYFEALSRLDRDLYVACFTSEAHVRDPYGSAQYEGEAGLNDFFDGMERTWEEFNMTPRAAYEGGDRLAVPWTTVAVAKNGKQAEFSGVNVFSLADDGRIEALDGYWDFKGMLAQIRE